MKAPKLETWTKNYSQDGDCFEGDGQDLALHQMDGGGGPFWVIETERWAFDSIDELVAMLLAAGVAQSSEIDPEKVVSDERRDVG